MSFTLHPPTDYTTPPQIPVEPIRLVARCFAESCDYTFGVFSDYKMSFN